MQVAKNLAAKYCILHNFLEKFFKKLSKKVLTRQKRCGIIVKLSARSGRERSLKIEQQERSTKHCEVRKTDLVKELYILKTK